MQNSFGSKVYLPVLYLFLGFSTLFLVLRFTIRGIAVNYHVLQIGNLLLFLVGWVYIRMSTKALEHKNVQTFLRLVYGSFLMKFFVLAFAAILYIAIYKKDTNIPALFGCFGLYFIYTFIELRTVMKQSKKRNA
jgi:L-asparagine transporter-like permease